MPAARNYADHVAVPLPDRRVIGVAEGRCSLDKRVQNLWQVECCTTNDLEHVGCSGLLLKRFAQLIEQARVLDGDHGLVREGLEQLDVLFRKSSRLVATNSDDPDGLVVLEYTTEVVLSGGLGKARRIASVASGLML